MITRVKKRKLWDFPGGIHPEEHKSISNRHEIQKAGIPTRLVLPLQQHIGTATQPIVAVGERVLKGQKIAECEHYVSATVHAPTSGTIQRIQPFPVQHPSELNGLCIEMIPDHLDEWVPHAGTETFWEKSHHELLDILRESGIVGLGGAGFPTHVKLHPTKETVIDTLILNGVECEPYITADDRLMRERAHEIIYGAYIIAFLVKPTEMIFAIEDNKPEAIAAMTAALAKMRDHALMVSPILSSIKVDVVTVPTKYPSGGEKQLIQILTGKEVLSGSIPADIGIVCQNVGSAAAVYRAIGFGEPLITRITTFTGEGVYKPGNYEVLIGTPIEEMFDQVAAREHRIKRLILGGPMMGFTLPSPKIPIVKTTNCIIAATLDEFPDPAIEQPCIRCGDCATVCPAELLPQQLYWHTQSQNFDQAQHHNLFDCIECGACAYVCPSKIPLVQYYRFGKGAIRKIEADNQKADHSRIRFEARQGRIEQEQAEKEAKRQARAKKAAQAQQAKATKNQTKTTDTPIEAGTSLPLKHDTITGNKIQLSQATTSIDNRTLLQLETAFNKAEKKWKDACKALTEKSKKGQIDLTPFQNKVDQLKEKLDAANQALLAAQQSTKHEDKGTATQATSDPAGTAFYNPEEIHAQEVKRLTVASAQVRVQVRKLQRQLEEHETASNPVTSQDTSHDTSIEQLKNELTTAQLTSQDLESQLQHIQSIEPSAYTGLGTSIEHRQKPAQPTTEK